MKEECLGGHFELVWTRNFVVQLLVSMALDFESHHSARLLSGSHCYNKIALEATVYSHCQRAAIVVQKR
jgi:hypothetical protein